MNEHKKHTQKCSQKNTNVGINMRLKRADDIAERLLLNNVLRGFGSIKSIN